MPSSPYVLPSLAPGYGDDMRGRPLPGAVPGYQPPNPNLPPKPGDYGDDMRAFPIDVSRGGSMDRDAAMRLLISRAGRPLTDADWQRLAPRFGNQMDYTEGDVGTALDVLNGGGGPRTGGPDPGPTPPPSSGPNTGPFPTFNPSPYSPYPNMERPPAFGFTDFAYDPFKPPSLQDAQNEPGYDFAKREGERALMNSAAARGAARTGGTLKDLLGWGQKFAEQNYQNVYNRSADAYDRNRGNAFGNWLANRENAAGTYSTNYGVARDVWDRNSTLGQDAWRNNFTAEQAAFNPKFRGAELTFEDLYRRGRDANDNTWRGKDDEYRRWRDRLDAVTRIATIPPLE